MTILDKEKTRQVSCSRTSTSVAFYEMGALGPHYEGVSWPSYHIDDSTIKYDSSGKVYKNLYHLTKVRIDMSEEEIPVTNSGVIHSGSTFVGSLPCDYIVSLLPALPAITDDQIHVGPDDPSAEFKQRAKNLKFVSTDTKFSVVNFVIELGELKYFFKNSKKLLKRLVRFARLGRFKTLGDIIATLILETSYGVVAFLRDIVTVWNICSKLNIHYKAFMENMGTFTSARNLVIEDPPLPADINFIVTIHGYRFEARVLHSRLKPAYTCACVVYKYWSLVMTQLYGKLKYFTSQVGLELNPGIAWNAIPFSFVIDWFYPVGKLIESYKIPTIDMSISMDSGGFGTHNQIRREIQVRQVEMPGFTAPGWYTVYTDITSVFTRTVYPLEDVQFGSLEFQGLTLNKALNASALLWTRYVR